VLNCVKFVNTSGNEPVTDLIFITYSHSKLALQLYSMWYAAKSGNFVFRNRNLLQTISMSIFARNLYALYFDYIHAYSQFKIAIKTSISI
jgi:hypothetical protein